MTTVCKSVLLTPAQAQFVKSVRNKSDEQQKRNDVFDAGGPLASLARRVSVEKSIELQRTTDVDTDYPSPDSRNAVLNGCFWPLYRH